MHDHGSFNRAYRLVFNEALGAVVAVPETARGRNRGGAGGSARAPAAGLTLRRLAVALAVGLSAPGVWAQATPALPQGGQVAAGQAQLTVGGSKLTVTQGSERAIINWHSFDIGSGAAVQFVQRSTSSVALNRVGGGVGSQILGTLQANGQVYLVNPAGILFGKTAQVDVGGLVASTLAMRDDDFLAGRDRFGGAGKGSVVNEGRITVQRGGRAVLLGRTVQNTGQISAPGGNVALVAGEHATLSVGANGHLQIAVDAAQVATLAANGGLIEADGGQVVLTAKGADALAASVVSNTGTIQARTVNNQQGRILLLGDMEHGTAQVAGTLDASAPAGGNGGFVETSAAHVQVADSARVTTLAPTGSAGTWLIDPTDFTIGAGAGGLTDNGIGNTTLQNNLADGNVTITTSDTDTGSEAGDIHVNAPVIWNDNTLTLNAHRNININAVMTAGDTAGLALNYGGTNGVSTATPAAGSNIRVALSDSGFTGRVDFTGTANSLSINGNTYTIIKTLGESGSTTGTDLQGMSANTNGLYALGANIDASATEGWNNSTGFNSIGTFSGVLEGLGHTVANLHINLPTGNNEGLIGQLNPDGLVRNVGLVGGSILAQRFVGSLVGQSMGKVSSSYSTATVAGDERVGGLVGFLLPGGTISDSHATGNVTGGSGPTGGLVGSGSGSISNSYATGTVRAVSEVGGLLGLGYGTTSVSGSYATGAVTGTEDVGGLVGSLRGSSTISDSYATGTVTGVPNPTMGWASTKVGGLVGLNTNDSTISNSYATGRVAGSFYVGGLVGRNASTIANSFWNSETSGVANGVGDGSATGATPKTTAEMQQLETFAGWDIDDAGGTGKTWRIYEGHTAPLLRSFLTPLTVQPAYDGSGTHMSHIGAPLLPAGADTSQLLGTGATGVVLSDGAAEGYTAALTGASFYSTQQGHDIAYAPRTIVTTGTAAGDIRLGNGVRWDNGMLAIDATGTVSSDDIAGGAGSVFDLRKGNWVQTTASLPAFAVGDFRLSGGSFLRAAGGDGSASAPYLLTDIYGVQGMASQPLLGQHFALANDVDAATTVNWNGGAGFRPIGTWAPSFTGQLDGQGHVVRELFIERPSEDLVGLFGSTGPGSVIQNLGLEGGSFRGRAYVGGLVGYLNGGSVTSSHSTANVTGEVVVGGLIGDMYGATVADSYAAGDVSGTGAEVGGLVGGGTNSTILNSHATGAVTGGKTSTGGLAGRLQGTTITDSYATGKVTGINNAGGLVGWAEISSIAASHATGEVTVTGHSAGGLLGTMAGGTTVAQSYATGNVSATDTAGGLVGNNYNFDSSISNSYATGRVAAQQTFTGGLVGYNEGSIVGSYATGDVSGGDYAGGLVGWTYVGSISDSYATGTVSGTGSAVGGLVGLSEGSALARTYATGKVSGSADVGGLLGYNDGGTVANSFWNVETSGTTTGVAAGDATGATGKTTEQMQQLGTFSAAGWDIDDAGGTGRVWRIYDGHTAPLLRSFLTPLAVQPAYDGSGTHMSHIGAPLLPAGVDASQLLGTGAAAVVLSDGAAESYTATLTGPGLYSTQQGYDIAYAPRTIRTIATPGTAAGDIRLDNGVRWDNGTLAIDATGTVSSAEIAGGAGSVFDLRNGNWVQNTPSLPAFAVRDFRLSGGSFLRAAGGDGSDAAPYLLTDIYGVQGMASQPLLNQHFALANDVDAAATANWNGGAGFRPIGTQAANFTGQLNGQEHVIRELFIDRPSEYVVGLFGYTAPGSVIQDVGLEGGSIRGKGIVGAVAGINSGIVSSTYATTRVASDGSLEDSLAGGLVGANYFGSILSSYATGDVSGGGMLGGLVGWTFLGGIADSYSTGTVSSTGDEVGGLVGRSDGSLLARTYATGKVSGGSSVGGLVGVNNGGGVDSFWNTETSGVATGIGGGDTTGVTGKTTEQMQQLATFRDAGWDIDDAGGTGRVWRIYDGHTAPLLRSFLTGLTVTPDAPLPGKTYDGAVASGSTGYALSDPAATVSGNLSYATTGVNAGSYDTAADTLRLSGLYSHQQGYDISYGNASVNIDRKVLGIAGLAAQNKEYDGTPDATVTFTGLAGIVDTDIGNVGLTLGAANFADRNAGQNKAVTMTGSNLIGTAAGNYAITEPTGLKADIHAKPITGEIRAADKEYDGTTAAATSGSFTGVLAADIDTVVFVTSGTFDNKNVGNKIVDVTGTLTGDNAGNYAMTANTTTTANITPKGVTGTITAADKVYDGSTAATTRGALTGVIAGDTVNIATAGSFMDKNAGPVKTVHLTSALTGTDANNYTLAANATTTANIDAAQLLVAANDAQQVANGLPYYGGNGVRYTGFVPGEDASMLGGRLLWGGTGQGAQQPGNYSLAVSGLAADNYRIAYGEGLLTLLAAVQPAPIAGQPTPDAGQLTPDVGQIDRITRQTLPRTATGDMLRSANSQVPLTVMENYLRVD